MNYLAEDIYKIDLNELPDRTHCDPRGELLLFSPRCGWIISHHTDIKEIVHDNVCTHWTYLPDAPFTG
jgi:hypothetical protein